jgi:hypothetical protein
MPREARWKFMLTAVVAAPAAWAVAVPTEETAAQEVSAATAATQVIVTHRLAEETGAPAGMVATAEMVVLAATAAMAVMAARSPRSNSQGLSTYRLLTALPAGREGILGSAAKRGSAAKAERAVNSGLAAPATADSWAVAFK